MLEQLLENLDSQEDKRSFTKIYKKYEQTILKVSYKHLDNPALLEDCIQETFLQLIPVYSTFLGLKEPQQKKYLITICKRCAYKLNNKETTSSLEEMAEEALYRPEDASFSDYSQAELVMVIKALNEKYSLPLLLKYADGYTNAEIAELLGLSENLVAQRLRRGKEKIRQALTGGGKHDR